MTTLQKLQEWYKAECNGDWEHSWGIRIETLDNPGWDVQIDLSETIFNDQHFDEIKVGNFENSDDTDWMLCKVEQNKFIGVGGPDKLDEILCVFLEWVKIVKSENTK